MNPRDALQALLDRYVQLVNSGDCGSWNPEEESVVIDARVALASESEKQMLGRIVCELRTVSRNASNQYKRSHFANLANMVELSIK